MFSRKATLVGIGAAIVALGTYIFLKPTRKKSKRRREREICAGLENFGNTCFVNCVLQALASCPTITEWLQIFTSQPPADSQKNEHFLASTLLKTVHALNFEVDSGSDTYSPADVLSSLRLKGWMFSHDEQDAHEFFHVVMETLDEETGRYPTVLSLFDTNTLETGSHYQPMSCARTRSQSQLPVLPRRTMENPFHGLLVTQLKCSRCSYQYPLKYGSFDSLSLNMPSNYWGNVSLTNLLANFMQSERLSDVECPGCAKVSGSASGQPLPRSSFIKKTTLAKVRHR